MPLDDDPGCEKTWADLLVSGDYIEIEEFTQFFAITPTEAGKAGSCSCWRVSSKSHLTSRSLEQHIHWILDQIADKKDVIKHLKEQRNCQVDLGCWWKGYPQSDANGPFLTPQTLRRVADFDLNLILYFMR
jgi:hypothetical protein